MEDSNLIKRLKESDEKAFDSIFFIYYPRVYHLANRLLNSHEEAEEITQQTFIAIWDNRLKIEEDKSFSAYIQSIARHLIYNQMKKAVYKQRFIDYSLKTSETSANLAEDQLYFDELLDIFKKAVSELPPKRREIFNLSRIEGLSYKDIAKRMSIQESTVNTQISKAIEFLKNKLKDYRFTIFLF